MPELQFATGGIILCGGQSSRMRRPKAWLPFGNELMLPRVTRILSSVVSPIVVVAAPGQELPPLPDDVQIVRDELEAAGPLAGLAVGLGTLRGEVSAAYVSSCDVPLLRPEFVQAMIDRLETRQIAIPRDTTYHHPLAAVYRTELEDAVRDLLTAGQRRLFLLLHRVATREVNVDELRQFDPELQSLRNINTPEEYAAVLREAGFQEDGGAIETA